VAVCLVALIVLVVFCGVALPAVWSADADRRQAALKTLQALLAALFRHEGKGG